MAALSHSFFGKKSISTSQEGWSTLFQVLAASLLMALCSQIKIVLPFNPIPLTLQTLAILLIGATLGSRKGAFAILLYYAEILIGLPVLAGGISNPLVFVGPSGGYVLGWCLQAFLMGWVVENSSLPRLSTLFLGGVAACTVQMGMGVWMLAQFVGWTPAWTLGLLPFLPGEILKILAVCLVPHSISNQNPLSLNLLHHNKS